MKEIYAQSMFVDSGAHGLYNIHVLKMGKREGKTSKMGKTYGNGKPEVRWSQGDFSWYDLDTRNSEFRKYCRAYAAYIKEKREEPGGKSIIFANVDAIGNPDLTWRIQQFFEQELGVQPIPIIHYGTPMAYVDRYIEAGRYSLLGVGGLGQGVSRHEYFSWGDEFFLHICPASNKYLPIIRTHGFAMTSWELICRWPWWSVDSATWVKLSAYGWLYVPRWSHERKDWRMDVPPMMVNVSHRSPQKAINGKHYEYGKAAPAIQETVDHWLKYIGLEMGSVKIVGTGKDQKEEVDVFGVSSHHRARSISNLTYLKILEESRPQWPHPLDRSIVNRDAVRVHRKGFGI